MYQALYKTSPHATAPQFSVVFASASDRGAFVQGSAVWWYMFPEDEDWDWHRGGAWQQAIPETKPTEQAPAPEPKVHGVLSHQVRDEAAPRPEPPAVPLEDEADDERW